MRTILLPLTTCLFIVSTASAKYSGGTGEPNDPYQIATAADLIALGETPADYDKHFILTADIDLDPNLPGRKAFESAVVAPDVNDMKYWFQGRSFTGVLDGNGHAISHLTIRRGGFLGLFGQLTWQAEVRDLALVGVSIAGSGNCVGALVGSNGGSVTQCYSTGAVDGNDSVGGLVGENYGSVAQCYSTGAVDGNDSVGGLVGENDGSVAQCYSSGVVSGSYCVGGLVGCNWGTVTQCYSTAAVSGSGEVGGLVGPRIMSFGGVTDSFWDTQTSGQATSAGGMGKTTAQMQTASTFQVWGTCGNGGIWTIDEGKDYPRLWWENRPGQPIRWAELSDLLQGRGTDEDPFLVHTADELNLIGLFSCEWTKHFKLMTDIDLSALDGKDGRPSFNVIATGRWECGLGSCGFIGTPFTGRLDGNGHTISHLTVEGAGCVGLFGCLRGGEVKNLGVVEVNITGSGNHVGGLVGLIQSGTVTRCYSSGVVSGSYYVGGLVGEMEYSAVTQCYSACAVRSENDCAGGLVGCNDGGSVSQCYSTAAVSGSYYVGGLVGEKYGGGSVIDSFWDTQTSGQAGSDGGTGKTTAEMQTAKTFLDAGWDFVGETKNGTEDIWWINEGKDYPRLWWEPGPHPAFSPHPTNGDTDVIQPVVLDWRSGNTSDVYFGDDETVVDAATHGSVGIYRGRQPADVNTYDPGVLEHSTTYYWRVDEVNETERNSVQKGPVWCFTTADYDVVSTVDDFESYTDDKKAGQAVFQTWLDGCGYGDPDKPAGDANLPPYHPGNATGSYVGNWDPPFAEQEIVHTGRQSMPMDYNNASEPWYSETERTWATPQDWTAAAANTLTLYFRGHPARFIETAVGSIRMSGGGTDASEPLTSDDFRFAWKRLSGDGSITACVDGLQGAWGRAEAGVMIRAALGDSSACAMMVVSPKNGVCFRRRLWEGNPTESTAQVGAQFPHWVRLIRTGKVFTAQRSDDGLTWLDVTTPAPIRIYMTADVYVGVVVSSHDPNNAAMAEFSTIVTTGNVTGEWQVADLGLTTHLGNDPEALYAGVEDSAGRMAVVVHPDGEAVLATEWQKWHIPFVDLRAAGVDVAAVRKMVIGVGDRNNPKPGGTGRIYVDDIHLTKRMP